jgi:hypothetical protein
MSPSAPAVGRPWIWTGALGAGPPQAGEGAPQPSRASPGRLNQERGLDGMSFQEFAAHCEVGARVATGMTPESLMMGRMPYRVVALVAVMLLVGATFCVFDDDHDARLDLCNLLLLPVASLALGAPSLLVSRMVSVPIQLESAAPPAPPLPPPRS